MKQFVTQMKQFMQEEDGASAVEYGVLVALIIVVCIAAIKTLGLTLNNTFTNVNDNLAPKP